MYYKKLKGERIYLSPIDIAHEVSILTRWVNEDEGIAFGNGFYPSLLGEEKVRKMLESWNEDPFCFSVVRLEDDAYLGQASLFQIDKNQISATLGIYIGEEYRHQGFGQEAMKLLMDYAFESQRFKAIHLEVFSYNEKAIQSYEKMGFVKCGIWHKARYHKGAYHDIVLMECLKEK